MAPTRGAGTRETDVARRTDVEIAAFLISTWGRSAAGLDEAAIADRLVREEGWRPGRAARTVARLVTAGGLAGDGDGRVVVASSPCLLSGHDTPVR